MKELPLIRRYRPDAPILHRAGQPPLTQAKFIGQATALARQWKNAPQVINLCQDRHCFMVTLAAALLRGMITLLPPSRGADHLAHMQHQYPRALTVTDGPLPQVPAWQGESPMIDADSGLLTVFTSGSTGNPQANTKTWARLAATIDGSTEALGLAGRAVNFLATVPSQHMYGMETVILMPLLAQGAAFTSCPFFAADIVDALTRLPPPRVLVTTPIHLRALAGAKISPPPLELIVSATAPLDADLATEAEAVFHTPVREIYGCSETASIAARRTVTDRAWSLYRGFHIEPDADGATVRGPSVDGAFHIEDRISLVGENGFELLGRSGDLVKLGGKRFSLTELTAVVRSVPGVEDAVVFMPSTASERPAALVVAPSLSEGFLRQTLANRIDAVSVPRPLRRVASLPRNELGKLPRAALLSLLESGR